MTLARGLKKKKGMREVRIILPYNISTKAHDSREYPAYRDERKRHISASKNGGSILTTVPERALEPILLSINFVMVRPILWP